MEKRGAIQGGGQSLPRHHLESNRAKEVTSKKREAKSQRLRKKEKELQEQSTKDDTTSMRKDAAQE